MATKSKRRLWIYLAVILLFMVFGLWVYWYFAIEMYMDAEHYGYIAPQLIINTNANDEMDDKISHLSHQIEVLKQQISHLKSRNRVVANEKNILFKPQTNDSHDDPTQNDKINLLLSAMDALNQKIWNFQDNRRPNTLQKQELLQQVQLLQTTNDDTVPTLCGMINNCMSLWMTCYIMYDKPMHIGWYSTSQFNRF
eukprot:265286_1